MTINPPINPIVAISVFYPVLDYFFYHHKNHGTCAKAKAYGKLGEKVTAKAPKTAATGSTKLNLVHT
jgi:hypothetical protein